MSVLGGVSSPSKQARITLHTREGGKKVGDNEIQHLSDAEAAKNASRAARIARLKAADKSPRPELKVGSGIAQCASCGLFFSGVQPFERHLRDTGSANPVCCTPEEMHSFYMVENKYGVWTYGRSVKEVENG